MRHITPTVTKQEMQSGVAYSMGHENHVALGTRFDATKVEIGKYFSTKIWEFRMKCKMCYHEWVIQTDPENRTFKCVAGCRRKIKEFDAKSAGTIEFNTKETRERMDEDAFFKLENLEDDKRKSIAAKKANDALEALQTKRKDDYSLNSSLRSRMRGKKKEHKKQVEDGKKLGLSVPLLPQTEEDVQLASEVNFSKSLASDTNRTASFRENYKRRRLDVATGSIFHSHDVERERKVASLKKQRQLGINHRDFAMPKSAALGDGVAEAGRLPMLPSSSSSRASGAAAPIRKRKKLKKQEPPPQPKGLVLVAYGDSDSDSSPD
jgi:hypothetical protein